MKDKDGQLNVFNFLKRFFLVLVAIFLSQVIIIWMKINIPLLGNIIGLLTIAEVVVSIYFSIYSFIFTNYLKFIQIPI